MKNISLSLVLASILTTASAVQIDKSWRIVRPDTGAEVVQFQLLKTAEELRRDIAEATGLTLPIVVASKAGEGPAIYLGETAARAAGLMPEGMRAFQNVIAEKGGSIYLFGHDAPRNEKTPYYDWSRSWLPTVRAAARFLHDRVGVRFLMPGSTGTEVTLRGAVTLPSGTFDRENPMMEYSTSGAPGMFYRLANGMFGSGLEHTYGGHSYDPAVNAHLDKYGKEHPEYFGLIAGKRVVKRHSPLCVSNPAVQELMIDELCRQFDAGAESCQLGQQDGFRGCECENCAKLGGEVATGDWGEKLWIFHADIARRLAKLRPGKIVHIMCYGPTAKPPKSFRVFPENVMIELCNYSERDFAEWAKYTVPQGFTVYTYLWGNYKIPGYTPKSTFPQMAMMARRFAREKIRGMFRCGYGELFGLEGPFYYIFNKLLENPDAEVKPILVDYCQAAFGPAAPQMIAFYERLNLQVQASSMIASGWTSAAIGTGVGEYARTWKGGLSPLPLIGYTFSPDAVRALEGALVKAEKTPGQSAKMTRRLALVRFEWTYVKNLARIANLYAAYKLAPSRESFAPLAAAVRERKAFLAAAYDKTLTKTPGKPADWPELNYFGGYGRASVETNGRLEATLSAPLNWDVDFLEKNGILPGASRKTMKAGRATTRPTLGEFDAGDWAKVPWQDFVGDQLQKISRTARAKVLFDDAALYVAIESDLKDDRAVRETGHDGPVWADECSEVLVDPTGDGERCYHILAAPHPGAILDEAMGLISDPLHPLFGKMDPGWNAKGVTVEHRRANDRWAALFRIPYADLGVSKPAAGDVWNVNLCRTWDFAGGSEGSFSGFWNPNLESKAFVAPEAMGQLVFE